MLVVTDRCQRDIPYSGCDFTIITLRLRIHCGKKTWQCLPPPEGIHILSLYPLHCTQSIFKYCFLSKYSLGSRVHPTLYGTRILIPDMTPSPRLISPSKPIPTLRSQRWVSGSPFSEARSPATLDRRQVPEAPIRWPFPHEVWS